MRTQLVLNTGCSFNINKEHIKKEVMKNMCSKIEKESPLNTGSDLIMQAH